MNRRTNKMQNIKTPIKYSIECKIVFRTYLVEFDDDGNRFWLVAEDLQIPTSHSLALAQMLAERRVSESGNSSSHSLHTLSISLCLSVSVCVCFDCCLRFFNRFHFCLHWLRTPEINRRHFGKLYVWNVSVFFFVVLLMKRGEEIEWVNEWKLCHNQMLMLMFNRIVGSMSHFIRCTMGNTFINNV